MSIYDEKKSKNNHNDCDLDFGDYTDLYKSHSLCDNRTSMKYDESVCKFNMDTGCVELLLRDGRMISMEQHEFP